MSNIKFFEIKDKGMTVLAMAVKIDADLMCERDCKIIKAAGHQVNNFRLQLTRLRDGETKFLHTGWVMRGRMMKIAHKYIDENFDDLASGEVIEIEKIAKEKRQ